MLDRLSVDVLLEIADYLNGVDLLSLSQVCKFCDEVLSDDSLWEHRFIESFGVLLFGRIYQARSGGSWKQLFRVRLNTRTVSTMKVEEVEKGDWRIRKHLLKLNLGPSVSDHIAESYLSAGVFIYRTLGGKVYYLALDTMNAIGTGEVLKTSISLNSNIRNRAIHKIFATHYILFGLCENGSLYSWTITRSSESLFHGPRLIQFSSNKAPTNPEIEDIQLLGGHTFVMLLRNKSVVYFDWHYLFPRSGDFDTKEATLHTVPIACQSPVLSILCISVSIYILFEGGRVEVFNFVPPDDFRTVYTIQYPKNSRYLRSCNKCVVVLNEDTNEVSAEQEIVTSSVSGENQTPYKMAKYSDKLNELLWGHIRESSSYEHHFTIYAHPFKSDFWDILSAFDISSVSLSEISDPTRYFDSLRGHYYMATDDVLRSADYAVLAIKIANESEQFIN